MEKLKETVATETAISIIGGGQEGRTKILG
jgi:hypothetical protein